MEFLDDVLQQREPKEQPEAAPEPQPDAPVGDPWQDLISGITLEEPILVEEKRPRGRRPGQGLTRGQKIVLGTLCAFVVLVWIVFVIIIAQSYAAQAADPANSPAVGAVGAIVNPEGSDDSETEDSAEVLPPNDTATDPNATPTPTPPIFTVFDRKIKDDPDNADLYVQRGQEYIGLGAYEAALGDFEHAQQLGSQRPETYAGLGWANYYLGRWPAAEEAFIQAVSSEAPLPDAQLGLGRLYYYQGRYREATTAFDTAAEMDRTSAEAEAWLAIAAARTGDAQEAEGATGRAMELDNTLAIVYIAQSWARRTQPPPNIDGTQGDLLYAVDLEPNAFLPLNALASFYLNYRPERINEAEQLAVYARNWADNSVDRAIALQTLGRIYLEQQRLAEAREVLTEADTLLGGNGRVLLPGLADDLARAGE